MRLFKDLERKRDPLEFPELYPSVASLSGVIKDPTFDPRRNQRCVNPLNNIRLYYSVTLISPNINLPLVPRPRRQFDAGLTLIDVFIEKLPRFLSAHAEPLMVRRDMWGFDGLNIY